MALNETNLDRKNGFFKTPNSFKEQFHIYWSSKQNDKHNGSGVALICSRKWNKHYQGHKFHSPYLLSAYFFVQKCFILNNRKNTVYDKLPIGNAHTKVLYDCDDIEAEKWDKFRLNIKSQLNSLDQEVIENKVYITEYSQEDIDRYWDKLNSFIVSTADSELPRKVIRLHNTFIRYNKKKTRPERHTNKLLKLLYNYYYGNQQMTTSVDAKSRWARKIAKYNQDYVTSTNDYNKCFWKTVIDKVLVNKKSEGSTKRLATEPEEVKEAVDNDFASMFRKRNTLQNSLTSLWQQIYESAGKFKEVMEATIEKVTMEEWNNTVKELNKNLTAGLSAHQL
ncbi:unnamed protein product [Rhizophagus irregularis]|nr:unnamed protein product [Rhizophagus irregularis]